MSQLCASSPFLTLSLFATFIRQRSPLWHWKLSAEKFQHQLPWDIHRPGGQGRYWGLVHKYGGISQKHLFLFWFEKKKVEFWNIFANMQLHNHSKRWWPLSVRTHWPVWIIQNSQCHWRVYNETCGNVPCVALDVHLLFIILFCCQQT